MSTKPKTVILSWKYRDESFFQWREAKTVNLDYDIDIDGGISGVQNRGSFNGPAFNPADEIIDVVAISVSAQGKRIHPRLIPLGAANTPLVSAGGVNATAVTFEVTEPTTAGDFSVNDFFKIDDEFLQITAIVEDSPSAGKDTWTVRRGEHRTTAVTHTINTVCYRHEWTVGKGYKQIILSGSPETGLPGDPNSLSAIAFSDNLGNAIQVTVQRPDVGTRTLRRLELQAKTTPVWADSNEHTTGLKTIRTTGTGTISQGGSTLVTTTDIVAAGVVAGDECYTYETINLSTGVIGWPRSARIKTAVDNGDGTFTITLIDNVTFSLSSGSTGTVNFIAAAGWQVVPTDFEYWQTFSVSQKVDSRNDPISGIFNTVIRTSNTIFIRARWYNLNGTTPWMYHDGFLGTTTKGSATTIAPNVLLPAAIPDNFITASKLTENAMSFSFDGVFSAASNVQADWTSGTLEFADGSTFSIVSGNTGTMAALTYIYFDPDVSTTVLQTTTVRSTALGDRKQIIASGKNVAAGEDAFFSPIIGLFGINSESLGTDSVGTAQIKALSVTANEIAATTITGAKIAALTITGGLISANTITASKLNVTTLSSIVANIGSITSGTITTTLVRTSASGNRVEIDNAQDDIRFYGTTGGALVILDFETGPNLFNITCVRDFKISVDATHTITLIAGGAANIVCTGTQVDILNADIDMNGNDIINAGLVELDSLTKDGAGSIVVNDNFDMVGNGVFNCGEVSPQTDETGQCGSVAKTWLQGHFKNITLNGVSYLFPAADGSSGQRLQTNGSGVLSWVTP